jgi:hypothetical protein
MHISKRERERERERDGVHLSSREGAKNTCLNRRLRGSRCFRRMRIFISFILLFL